MSNRNVTTTQPLMGRRREGRLRVGLQARLMTLDGMSHAVLADVSRSGARIVVTGHGLRQGSEAVLSWDRFEAFGKVVWSDGQHLGLLFYDSLPTEVVAATRAIEDARVLPPSEQAARDAAQTFVNPRYKI